MDELRALISTKLSSQVEESSNLKLLEGRTKSGFTKVKTDFKTLTESLAATQKETDAEQDKVLE